MLFIAGYHGSGKSTAANYLHDQHNYLHTERSSVLSRAKDSKNSELPMREWREQQMSLLGRFALEDIIRQSIREQFDLAKQMRTEPQGIVVTGNRSMDEIYYTAASLTDIDDRKPTIIAIKADVRLLFKRYTQRGRSKNDKDIGIESFTSMLQREKDAGIEAILESATHTIINNGSTAELNRSLDDIVAMQRGCTLYNETN